jgi:nicotinamide-nucleotide amidase
MEDLVMKALVESIAHQLIARQWMLATAESCTGGLIAAQCTDLSGSSLWFDRGFVSYSNDAKSQLLGVPSELIESNGAVSEQVALAMALGAVYRSKARASVAVTGVAGPTGGSPDKPVGTVWIAWCIGGEASAQLYFFSGDRQAIRSQTVEAALGGLSERLLLSARTLE